MALYVVISAEHGGRRYPAGGVAEKTEIPLTNVCLIVCGWLGCLLSHCFVTKRCRKQQDDLVRVVLLEALAQRFMAFGENDVRPRVIRTHRVGGPGRG